MTRGRSQDLVIERTADAQFLSREGSPVTKESAQLAINERNLLLAVST